MNLLGFQVRPAIFLVEADAGRREEPPRYESVVRAHGSNQRFHRLPGRRCRTGSHYRPKPRRRRPGGRGRLSSIRGGGANATRDAVAEAIGVCGRLTGSRGAVADHPRSMAFYPSFLGGKTPNFGERLRDAPGCVMASTQRIPHSPGLCDSATAGFFLLSGTVAVLKHVPNMSRVNETGIRSAPC